MVTKGILQQIILGLGANTGLIPFSTACDIVALLSATGVILLILWAGGIDRRLI